MLNPQECGLFQMRVYCGKMNFILKSEHPKRIGKGAHHYSKTESDATLLGVMALIRYF